MNDNYKKKESLIRELGVFELRGLARQLGVPSPTTKKRDELIALILAASNNEVKEDSPKRGRPYKRLNILDVLTDKITTVNNKLDFDAVIKFEQNYVLPNTAEGDHIYTFEGIFRKSNENARLYDIKTNSLVFFNNNIEYFSLAETGDKVKVEAKELVDKDGFIALQIIEINGVSAELYQVEEEELGEEIIDDRVLPFGNKAVVIGRRNIHLLEQDIYETDDFEDFYNYCFRNDFHFILLGVNTSFENQIKFKNLDIDDNFSTVYGSDLNENINKIIDVILYSNNMVARGENVVLFVSDIIEILKNLDEFYGVEQGQNHSQKGIVIIQKLLSFARSYDNDRSGTLFMCYNEIDKEDKFLINDILKISKKV